MNESYPAHLPAPFEAARQIVTGFRRMLSVLLALIFKDYKGRSSRGTVSIIASLIQPLIRVIFFSLLWYSTGHTTFSGVPAILYVAAGVFFFMVIQAVIQKMPNAINNNQALLGFPQVKPIDALMSRFVVETMLLIVSFGLLTLGLYWFFDIAEYVKHPLQLIGLFFLTLCIAFGLGLIVGVYGYLYNGVRPVVAFLSLPLFFTSGALHPVSGIATDYRQYLSWNPLFHIIEFARYFWFGIRLSPETSLQYALFWAAFSMGLGTLVYYSNRQLIAQR